MACPINGNQKKKPVVNRVTQSIELCSKFHGVNSHDWLHLKHSACNRCTCAKREIESRQVHDAETNMGRFKLRGSFIAQNLWSSTRMSLHVVWNKLDVAQTLSATLVAEMFVVRRLSRAESDQYSLLSLRCKIVLLDFFYAYLNIAT